MAPKKLKLRKATPPTLKSYKTVYFRRLNNIHISTQVTTEALKGELDTARKSRGAVGKSKHRYFEVPSGGKPTARIRREPADVEALVSREAEEGVYQKALVLAVSIAEDYIVNVMKLMLRAHPERLIQGVRGGESRSEIKLADFVNHSREELLERQIQDRLGSALYASPSEYLTYLHSILQVQAPADTMAAFAEVKATRDIVVHANGRTNEVYLRKAGALARAQLGEQLPIAAQDFDRAISTMKTLIRRIHDQVCAHYKTDQAVEREAARFLD